MFGVSYSVDRSGEAYSANVALRRERVRGGNPLGAGIETGICPPRLPSPSLEIPAGPFCMCNPPYSIPGPVYLVYTSTDKGAFRAQQESNHTGRLLDRAPPPECGGLVERGIAGATSMVPFLLHQRRVDGAWSNAIDAHLPMSILLCRSFGEPNEPVFAGVVGRVVRKPCEALMSEIQTFLRPKSRTP